MATFERKHTIAIIGGGPGGYEAALAGAQLGAEVTLIERAGVGGSTVLTDVVPSKSLIATADAAAAVREAGVLGVKTTVPNGAGENVAPHISVDLATVNKRLMEMASAQSSDMRETLLEAGVKIIDGTGALASSSTVAITPENGGETQEISADTIVVAVGASPRELDSAKPDGERILTWKQLYSLPELPEHLIVIGSGVTGAEFASAYQTLGSQVTLVSSRDQVLPGEDSDAAAVIERVFKASGMTVLNRSRAKSVVRTGDGVTVELEDGRTVDGSHCLVAVG
ncbi:MAG: FAD-dependent oxidoreductase, partial [Microbacteriaceae bacterium]|nr:FAD-dependent oxidoreductase [Microbacteriaceae bacterium]